MRTLTGSALTATAVIVIVCFTAAVLSAVAFATSFLVVCLALAGAGATAFFAAIFASVLDARFAATTAASAVDCLVLLRNDFGTGNVPNFLC